MTRTAFRETFSAFAIARIPFPASFSLRIALRTLSSSITTLLPPGHDQPIEIRLCPRHQAARDVPLVPRQRGPHTSTQTVIRPARYPAQDAQIRDQLFGRGPLLLGWNLRFLFDLQVKHRVLENQLPGPVVSRDVGVIEPPHLTAAQAMG